MDLTDLLCMADVEAAARAKLDPATYAYVAGGAGSGSTLAANLEAFAAVRLSPRLFGGGGAAPALGRRLFDREMPMPLLLAPTSPQRLLHPDAELATVQGAARLGVTAIVSADSYAPFPQIAAASAAGCWFQLYCYGGRAGVEALVDYAEGGGAEAIVLTADADHAARRLTAQRAGFTAPADLDLGTLRALGLFDGRLPPQARLERTSLNWQDLAWLRGRVHTPLIVKGVMRGEDARRCLDLGVDGLIVSNHGGRQLDGSRASLAALPEVLDAVGDRVPVLLDSGVRSGLDIVRALTLGATAVCVGRPYLWGLALAGADGVARVLELLRLELLDTLRQLGVAGVASLAPAPQAAPASQAASRAAAFA